MATTLWDTTGSAVVAALAAERRESGAVAAGLALTLVAVVDEARVKEAEAAAVAAVSGYPCRLLTVVRRRPDAPEPRLDAEITIGGRIGSVQAVTMRMFGRLSLHAESVVLPLLAPDAPVVTWIHGAPPDKLATDPLCVLADRRITDSSAAADVLAALGARAHDYAPGDTDLAWTQISPWRALLATACDGGMPGAVTGATVTAPVTAATTALMTGWLRSRLGLDQVDVVDADGPLLSSVTLHTGDSTVEVTRTDAERVELRRGDEPARELPLARRTVSDLLAEELRRLEDDAVYAEALGAWAEVPGLMDRASTRRHVWVDPVAS